MRGRAVGQAIACTFVVSVLSVSALETAAAQNGRPVRTLTARRNASVVPDSHARAVPGGVTATTGTTPRVDVAQADRLEAIDPRLRSALADLAAGNSPLTLCLVAEAYAAAGVLDTAYDRASEAIALDPRNARAYDLRARLWRRWGMPELGLGDAHRAAYFAPWSPEAQSALGTMLEALCQPDAARSAYERALHLDPSAAYARVNLARMSAESGWTRNACASQGDREGRSLGLGSRR